MKTTTFKEKSKNLIIIPVIFLTLVPIFSLATGASIIEAGIFFLIFLVIFSTYIDVVYEIVVLKEGYIECKSILSKRKIDVNEIKSINISVFNRGFVRVRLEKGKIVFRRSIGDLDDLVKILIGLNPSIEIKK